MYSTGKRETKTMRPKKRYITKYGSLELAVFRVFPKPKPLAKP
jgi:hypothetical protein